MAQAMSRDMEQEQYVRHRLRYHGASSHICIHTQISVCSLVVLHSYIHSFIDVHSVIAHQHSVIGCRISYSLYIIVKVLAYSVTIEYCSALYCPYSGFGAKVQSSSTSVGVQLASWQLYTSLLQLPIHNMSSSTSSNASMSVDGSNTDVINQQLREQLVIVMNRIQELEDRDR